MEIIFNLFTTATPSVVILWIPPKRRVKIQHIVPFTVGNDCKGVGISGLSEISDYTASKTKNIVFLTVRNACEREQFFGSS
jgi:hypothetical protein